MNRCGTQNKKGAQYEQEQVSRNKSGDDSKKTAEKANHGQLAVVRHAADSGGSDNYLQVHTHVRHPDCFQGLQGKQGVYRERMGGP